jgi:hypothetical protein
MNVRVVYLYFFWYRKPRALCIMYIIMYGTTCVCVFIFYFDNTGTV